MSGVNYPDKSAGPRKSELSLLYRGDLASCNYDCHYCPFAKRVDAKAVTERDRVQLARFVQWCKETKHLQLRILFTPWGEALVRKHYREALLQLSDYQHVIELGVQTNLSRNPNWLANARKEALNLWCTYHPSQTSRADFLKRATQLLQLGVRFSVGMVALKQDLLEIQAMRLALNQLEQRFGLAIYLWLNAYDQRTADYYSSADIAALSAIDPHFAYNLQPAASLGASCGAGSKALSVDANGDVKPCHFVSLSLGNLYDGSFAQYLQPRTCPNQQCECYIGYAQRLDLPFSAPLTRGFAPMPLTQAG